MLVDTNSYAELKTYYDTVLNVDKSTYKSSNDEPTPIACIEDMLSKIPAELWERNDLSILDPCCGNGNFGLVLMNILIEQGYDKRDVLENILEFNDINTDRLNNVNRIFCADKYALNVTNDDYLEKETTVMRDLIVANPPYAKLLLDGARASKNHNLIKDFLRKSLEQLKPNGYLVFITPDNWMSYADRNTLIQQLTELQIVHLDIHSAKKYFKKIGSSFTWYVIKKAPATEPITISGIWKNKAYTSTVRSQVRNYIPLYYTAVVQSILGKTLDKMQTKLNVETSSDLHHYTKKTLIRNTQSAEFNHRLIHTPKQTVYASRPHKYQAGFKVFISTTDKYNVYVDNCGMTQSIAFIRCKDMQEAKDFVGILQHPLYVFLNNICRWGNFNNIRILQSFPVPSNPKKIYESFGITKEEIDCIVEYT